MKKEFIFEDDNVLFITLFNFIINLVNKILITIIIFKSILLIVLLMLELSQILNYRKKLKRN